MKKKIARILSLALLAAACLGVTAYAMTPAPGSLPDDPPVPEVCAEAVEHPQYINEPPLQASPNTVEVDFDISVAGKSGNRYGPGDLVVLSAAVTNNSTEDFTAELWFSYPEDAGTVIASPGTPYRDNRPVYLIDGLAPGGTADLALVIRAGETCETPDWTGTASLYIGENGGAMAVNADAHFGQPVLKADRSALLKDGMLRVRNTGNGGASRVKFQFLAKKEWQTQDGLADGMAYIGEGRIEVDLGGIAAGGKLEKDISGLLHQRLDPSNTFEIIYELDPDVPVEYGQWEETVE